MRVVPLFSIGLFLCLATGLSGCGDSQKSDPRSKFMTASCKSDDNCGDDFICKDGTCQKGKRSKEELAKKEAAEKAEAARKLAEKRKVKPGETRMEVRVCPVFKNTPEAVGTITAKHTETGKEHHIHMALVTKEGGWQDVFTYWSLPLGKYEVTASYGINVRGHTETVLLKCHDKLIKDAKQCKNKVVRLMEAVPLDQIPAPKKDDKGNEIKIPCDWIVE